MPFLRCLILVLVAAVAWLPPAAASDSPGKEDDTYSKNEILRAAQNLFGETTEGLAEVVEKAFAEKGRPNAYILGQEGGAAFIAGARYGEGTLNRKSGPTRKVYWQGPSVGFDFGGNASKVLVLVYRLDDVEQIYQRFPGVDGSLYVVAGLGLNYNQSGDVIVAPIRTGVGLRAGVNVGYIGFTREASVNPF